MTLSAIFSAAGGIPGLIGCATGAPAPRRLRNIGSSPPFVVSQPRPTTLAVARGDVDKNAFAGDWILAMLPAARKTVEAAGFDFRHRVVINAHRDISEFVKATGQTQPHLRAWTTYSEVHLLARTFWRDQSDRAAMARLVHELVHVAMFHTFANEEVARAVGIPFFFLEGAASQIASQGFARMPLRALPHSPSPLTQKASTSAQRYGAAHHAGEALVRLEGAEVFARVTKAAAVDGTRGAIERALLTTCGLTPDALWTATVDEARRTEAPSADTLRD